MKDSYKDFTTKKNQTIYTLNNFGDNYMIDFWIKTKEPSTRSTISSYNIMKITKGGDDKEMGDRIAKLNFIRKQSANQVM